MQLNQSILKIDSTVLNELKVVSDRPRRQVLPTDEAQLAQGSAVFDSLYEYFKRRRA